MKAILFLMIFPFVCFSSQFKQSYTQDEILDACLEYKRRESNNIIEEYQEAITLLPDPESTGATHLAIFYNGISTGTRNFNCFTILRIAGG